MSALSFLLALALAANPVDGNRLAYLDGHDIYYPHANFPKLITPKWVGEDGVEAVVILAIDDMREPPKYETYLRPILQRLKAIDGRAPVSIMTCAVKPDDPQLQTWLAEGLSLEIHTFDHPCPLLQGGDFNKAKNTYDKCVDLLFSVPNNAPVAFRMPCCDSLNTVSPRFYKEIFNKTTPNGKFLQISSSVFQVFTAADPTIPKELLFDADGQERFRKYFPKGLKRGDQTHDRFVNYIENYPYPYVIDRLCWEFPCMTPSDWEANFLHQPNNPKTVDDLKAALDITVFKQGVLNLVFHPHGWIKPEQVNELIDHAVAKHGKKVKFLTFKEALERLNKNLLDGGSLRRSDGSAIPYAVADLNNDGFLDVGLGSAFKMWDRQTSRWASGSQSIGDVHKEIESEASIGLKSMVDVNASGEPIYSRMSEAMGKKEQPAKPPWEYSFLRDLDGDGRCELIRGRTHLHSTFYENQVLQWNVNSREWLRVKFDPPPLAFSWVDPARFSKAARFVDINEDGTLDLIFSDPERYGIWLFGSLENGWTDELMSGRRGRGSKTADQELPPIVRADGTDNGFFVRDRALHWMNEDTADRPNLIVSVDFDKLLAGRMPDAKTPRAALESMRTRPGFTVELMACEPLTMDPVAMAWGADGKFWVVEMADYPNGMDGRGKPGGRVRFLEDTDGDGQYDQSTLFLDEVPFPNGVHPWKNGVLISAAPDVFFAADTNGDGKADVREVLYTGFAEGNQQHRVNGFTYGLDGWLYLANGDSGGGITSTKTGEKLDMRGRDIRIHPETGQMDAVSGQSQFGRNRDDWGHWFGNNNSRPLYHYVLEDRYLRRNPNYAAPDPKRDVSETPGAARVYPASKTLTRFNDFDRVNRFTSACSTIVYRDDLLWEGLRVDGRGLRVRQGSGPLSPVRGGEGQGEGASASKDTPTDTTPLNRKSSKSSTSNKDPLTLTLSPADGGEGTGNADPQPSTLNPQLSSDPQPSALSPQLTFVSEPVHNLVHCELMTPQGVSFTSRRLDDEQESEFLASTDNWFRPTQLKTGPDGALWVADMYRLVIEHPQWIPQEWQEKLNVRAGDDKGRIWRVYPANKKPRAIPRLDKLTTEELVAALDSPSGWQRDMAQQLLIERIDKAAIPLLREAAKEGETPEAKLHALGTLVALDALTPDEVMSALRDEHPMVRSQMLNLMNDLGEGSVRIPNSPDRRDRAAVGQELQDAGDRFKIRLKKLADDPHPTLRLQLATVLGNNKVPYFSGYDATLAKLARHGQGDKYLIAAVFSSLHANNIAGFAMAVLEPNATALDDDFIAELTTQLVAFNQPASLTPLIAPAVAQPIANWSDRDWKLVERFMTSMAKAGHPWKKWNEQSEPPIRWTGALQDRLAEAVRISQDDKSPAELRVAAARLSRYAEWKGDAAAEALKKLLQPSQPPEVQLAAVQMFGNRGDSAITAAFIGRWRELSPTVRNAARDALLGRNNGCQALLEAVEAGTLITNDFDAVARQRLLDHADKSIRSRAEKLLGSTTSQARAEVIAKYQPTVRTGGDTNRGGDLFRKTCAQCHKLGDVGFAVGPDLRAMADKSPEYLLTAVLDPNRAVESRYLTYTAVTSQGQAFTGLLETETATSITLLAAEGKQQTLLRTELEEFVASNKSLMPEGLEKDVSPQMLADMIAFVRANVPLPARKEFPGNTPRVVTANDGKLLLLPADAEIYGSTIVLESQHQNLGWWSSADDAAVWTVEVPEAGRYAVTLDYACESHAAGHRLVIDGGKRPLTHRVEATAGWDDYRTATIGELELAAGVQRLTFHPASRPLPAMMDLKSATLVRQ